MPLSSPDGLKDGGEVSTCCVLSHMGTKPKVQRHGEGAEASVVRNVLSAGGQTDVLGDAARSRQQSGNRKIEICEISPTRSSSSPIQKKDPISSRTYIQTQAILGTRVRDGRQRPVHDAQKSRAIGLTFPTPTRHNRHSSLLNPGFCSTQTTSLGRSSLSRYPTMQCSETLTLSDASSYVCSSTAARERGRG